MAMVKLAKITHLLRGKLKGMLLCVLLGYFQYAAGQESLNDSIHYIVYFDDPVLQYDPNYLSSCGTGVDFLKLYHHDSEGTHLVDLLGEDGTLANSYFGIKLLNENFSIHAQKTNCKRPKSADYNATWDMTIQFNPSLYGLMNSYQIGTLYPPAVTYNTFNHYFSPSSYINIGITPPKPNAIFRSRKDGGKIDYEQFSESDSIYMSTAAEDIVFPRDSALYGYEIQWRANNSDTWKSINTKYPFKMPYSKLTESTKEGRFIYFRSRIFRKNGDAVVKYSPFFPVNGKNVEVKKKIDVKKEIVEACYCAEKTAVGHFNVNSITPGDTIKIVKRGSKLGFADTTLAKVYANNSDVHVNLPVGSYYLIYEYWGAVDSINTFSLKLADSIYISFSTTPRTLNVKTTPKAVTCFGGSDGEIAVEASNGFGGYRYSLDDKVFSPDSLIQNLTFKTNYSVYVSDSKGCHGSVTGVEVSQPTDIIFRDAVIKPVNCNGGNDGEVKFSVTGGTLPYAAFKLKHGLDSLLSNDTIFRSLKAADNCLVIVKDANGCADTLKNIEITQPAEALALSSVTYNKISCPGGSNGKIELSASGGTPGYDYSLDKVNWVKNPSFINLSHSDSTFFARDTLGCLDTLYHPIQQPDPIRASKQITNVTCFGDSNGSAEVILSGGTPLYRLAFKDTKGVIAQLSDISDTTRFSDLKSGDYKLLITDDLSCIDSSTFRVEQPPLPLSLAIDSASNPTCFGSANGVVHLKPTGGWGGYTFNHAHTPESKVTGLFNALAVGKHTFSITDSMGCARSIDTTLTQPTKLERQSITVTSLRCYGDGSGAVEVTAKGGTPSYKYDFGLGFTKLGARSGLMGGKLPFIIRDSLGCEVNDTAIIPQPETLKALISSRNGGNGVPSCSDSVRIKASGGVGSYTLSILGKTAALSGKGYLLYDQPNGRYPLVISDGNGCSTNDTANISNLPKPEFRKVDIFSPSCANSTDGRVAIDAWSSTGGETFSWYFVTPTENKLVATTTSNAFNAARKGRYLVRIVDQYFCSTDSVVDVSGPSDILFSLRNHRDPKCHGYADGNIWVEAMGGNGAPYAYQWFDSNHVKVSAIDSTGIVPAGEYYVVAKDLNGCKDSTTYILTDPPSLNPVLPPTVTICKNQKSFSADAGVEANSYVWTSSAGFSATTRVASLTDAGTYTLIISDSKGCQGNGNLTLLRSDRDIAANFIVAEKACVGDTLVLIEMSWPIPELIEWDYPTSFRKIDGNDYSVYLVATEEGKFDLKLTSHVGECWADTSKTIIIEPAKDKGDKSDAQQLIRSVSAFPNPNNGNFSVGVELSQSHDAVLEIYSLYGQRIQAQYGKGLTHYNFVVNQFRTPGIYLVRVTVGNEQRSLRVIVQ